MDIGDANTNIPFWSNPKAVKEMSVREVAEM